MKRYAIVRGLSITPEMVAAYLPGNYRVIWFGKTDWDRNTVTNVWKQVSWEDAVVVIEGKDDHGWTLHGYIAPRLGSGLMRCDEIDLSHPIMKQIPDQSSVTQVPAGTGKRLSPTTHSQEEKVVVKYEQTEEPVVSPEGFGRPVFKIGQRVRVVFTTLSPNWLKKTEGKTGTVRCVVFCKSDGRTILYGVEFDQRSDGTTGGRYESFELDEINE